MKRVLLVTLQGANIGNRLQNYALQEVIKREGCEVYTPYYSIPENNTMAKRIKNIVKMFLALAGVQKYKYLMYSYKRQKRFNEFNKKYICNRFKVKFNRIQDKFDYAVTGSDQVWHKWSDDEDELDYFYLSFMPEEKRISYAPSFGFEKFPEKDKEKHIKGLKGIKYLSCREEEGRNLIKQIVGREALVTLDPTLLLEQEEWKKIEKKPEYEANKYVLVYFLGEKTEEYRLSIEILARDNSLDIIDIYDTNEMKYYYTTPDEFIWLVDNASFVCTDSFHACVFSLIFEKKFLAFRRNETGMEKMFARISNLFSLTGIDREYKGHIEEIYKESSKKSIEQLKAVSMGYIINALSNKERLR